MTFDELKSNLWNFLTKGPLFYLTVPVAVIALVVVFFASLIDGGSKLAYSVRDAFSEKTSYLSKHELEILNEWVALIDYADTYEQAIDRSKQFKEAYANLGSGVWSNNILYVRDPTNKDRWMIVVDIWPSTSSCGHITREIARLQDDSDRTRILQDTVGMWLFNSKAIEFNLQQFEKTYGSVTNLPQNMKSHQPNPSGQCW